MYERLAPLTHDSLDDVPEPSENLELIGHQDVRDVIAQAMQAERLPHGLLLAGPSGVGKTTLAFHLATKLLEGGGGALGTRDPSTNLYRQIVTRAHPGILYLTRPYDDKTKKFRAMITVDEIRRVSRFLSMRTHDGGYRVIIVDAAEDMNNQAANALLKNLEEPPFRTIFILISHAPGRLLPTIRSRVQTISFAPLAGDDVLRVLANMGSSLPDDAKARDELARRSGGSVRAALLLNLHGGLEIAETVDRIITERNLDTGSALKLADALSRADSGIQLAIFNELVLEHLSGSAKSSAEANSLHHAMASAEAWSQARTIIAETEAYNLDKKQHVMAMLGLMRAQISVAS